MLSPGGRTRTKKRRRFDDVKDKRLKNATSGNVMRRYPEEKG